MQAVVIISVGKCPVDKRTEIQGYAGECYGSDDRYAESGKSEGSGIIESRLCYLSGILGVRVMEREEKPAVLMNRMGNLEGAGRERNSFRRRNSAQNQKKEYEKRCHFCSSACKPHSMTILPAIFLCASIE